MNFVYQAFYNQSSDSSQSSNYTYFTKQALQCNIQSSNGGGGQYNHFLGNHDAMIQRQQYNESQYNHFLGNHDAMIQRQLEKESQYNQFQGNHDDMIQRQLEKEMIRKEIIAEEAARRRELEAEVRRELMVERELELLRRDSDQWQSPPYTSYYNQQLERRSFERIALPAPEPERLYDYPLLGHRKIGGYEDELPFQRAPQPMKTEAKLPSIVFTAKKQKEIIFEEKPDANHSRSKRKEVTSPIVGPSEVTKKIKKEWSCALCQISATSELGLKDHLKGKKHKSKQDRSTGQKAGKIGLCSKKTSNPLEPSQVAKNAVSEKLSNLVSEKSPQTSRRNENKVKNNKISIDKKVRGGAVQKLPKNKKMKFKFWCELCETGAFCEEVMNNHKKGKKHLFRLHHHGARDEAIVST